MPTPLIAIVGGDSLLGREVRDVLQDRHLNVQVELLGVSEEAGLLTQQGDEPVFISAINKDQLRAADLVILTGTADAGRKAYALLNGVADAPPFLDLVYALEDDPKARLRAPQIETEPGAKPLPPVQQVAHPAAIALALLLPRLHAAHPIERCVATILAPASEYGQKGLSELQQQTVSLLAFQKLNKEVFDAQASFNLLPRLGSDAPQKIEETELRIERHLTTLLAGRVPLPSLRVVQAPVFHGYSFSLWIELTAAASLEDITGALASADIDVRTEDEEHPNNVAVASQSGVTAGAFEIDRNSPRAFWMWAVADNFRVQAEAAASVVAEGL